MDITENWSIYVGDDELTKYHEHCEQTPTMAERAIRMDDGKDIVFTGRQLGYTTWRLSEATEINLETHLNASLYITEQGKYICELDIDQLYTESTIGTGAVCETHDEIVAFFGLAYQFKLFYRQLQLDKLAYEIHVL